MPVAGRITWLWAMISAREVQLGLSRARHMAPPRLKSTCCRRHPASSAAVCKRPGTIMSCFRFAFRHRRRRLVTPAAGQTAEKDGPPVRSADGKEITVNLKNVSNAQSIQVCLLGVNDGTTQRSFCPDGILIGDTTANGAVNSTDIGKPNRSLASRLRARISARM